MVQTPFTSAGCFPIGNVICLVPHLPSSLKRQDYCLENGILIKADWQNPCLGYITPFFRMVETKAEAACFTGQE